MTFTAIYPGSTAAGSPWDQPLAVRVRWLARGPRRVAYLAEGPEPGTFRYRVFNMVDALNQASARVSAAWFYWEEWDEVIGLLPILDAIVVGRCRYNYRLEGVIARAHASGVDVIYDVDDLVTDVDLVPLIFHTHGLPEDEATWDFWFAYVGRLAAALRQCDRLLVTTQALAKELRARTEQPVAVVPNFMNRWQLGVSRPLFEAKRDSDFAVDAPIHLGYFSGTPSHANDFAIVSDALARLLDREPRVRVRCVGHLDLKGPLARHADDRVDWEPFQHFLDLQETIALTEVNLIPLQDNVFNDCKSELKYFEAAAVGTVSVASPSATYQVAIKDGTTGLLAREHEWEDRLSELVSDLLTDRRRYNQIALEAHRHAVSAYAWDRQVATIEEALLGSRQDGQPLPARVRDVESCPRADRAEGSATADSGHFHAHQGRPTGTNSC